MMYMGIGKINALVGLKDAVISLYKLEEKEWNIAYMNGGSKKDWDEYRSHVASGAKEFEEKYGLKVDVDGLLMPERV